MRTTLRRDDRSGQVLVLFAVVVLPLVLIALTLTADVGRMLVARAQLQNAVDAAALAGASQLVGFVSETSKQAARTQALAFAKANKVVGKPLNLGTDGVQFGHFAESTSTFVPEANFAPGQVVDSMQVTGLRRQGAPDGPIDLFFASAIFGLQGAAEARRAVATQPRRYVMFVMDRSGSMCFDTTNIDKRSSPNTNGSMSKSTTGWYWMPHKIYTNSWKTAYFYAKNDSTGKMVTDFLPSHIRSNLLSGTYFRYLAPDDVSTIQSGWLKAPSNVTIYSYYGSSYKNWSADAYGPVSSCDYALARNPIEPVASSQNAAMAFVDLLNTDRDEAGLVTYAWAAILEHALTDNFAALKTSIAAYDPRGATATPAGMQAANDEFILSGRASAYGHRVMVLLTDGMANTVSGTYYDNPSSKVRVSFFGEQVSCYIYQAVATALETQTRRARENGIRVYTVSFGTDSDKDLMPRIARATNGAYYYAADHQDLTDIFQDIFYNLPAVLTK